MMESLYFYTFLCCFLAVICQSFANNIVFKNLKYDIMVELCVCDNNLESTWILIQFSKRLLSFLNKNHWDLLSSLVVSFAFFSLLFDISIFAEYFSCSNKLWFLPFSDCILACAIGIVVEICRFDLVLWKELKKDLIFQFGGFKLIFWTVYFIGYWKGLGVWRVELFLWVFETHPNVIKLIKLKIMIHILEHLTFHFQKIRKQTSEIIRLNLYATLNQQLKHIRSSFLMTSSR